MLNISFIGSADEVSIGNLPPEGIQTVKLKCQKKFSRDSLFYFLKQIIIFMRIYAEWS